jgi:catechol 2,3-dioxygenase-like lactoylglutathione lyase family enzyme
MHGVEALMALAGDTAAPAQRDKPAPALKLNFLSHGTLESRDLAFSRRFYEEFLGLEVVQTSPISLLIRLGGPNTIAVVYSKNVGEMNLLNHNGLDVRSQEEVDEVHRIVCAQAEQWRLKKISKPHLQHGTYSFFFWDGDDNCWEILTNPEGGYSWLFERGVRARRLSSFPYSSTSPLQTGDVLRIRLLCLARLHASRACRDYARLPSCATRRGLPSPPASAR